MLAWFSREVEASEEIAASKVCGLNFVNVITQNDLYLTDNDGNASCYEFISQ